MCWAGCSRSLGGCSLAMWYGNCRVMLLRVMCERSSAPVVCGFATRRSRRSAVAIFQIMSHDALAPFILLRRSIICSGGGRACRSVWRQDSRQDCCARVSAPACLVYVFWDRRNSQRRSICRWDQWKSSRSLGTSVSFIERRSSVVRINRIVGIVFW